ncbi:MAG TPA: hypothetical protein VN721_05470 [Flavipsychrobacter sp.]|nr:hypothetical protein [Flavipsychrobacter sp.]
MSYLYPVRFRRGNSEFNPVLELYLYRNQWQLATIDALYSDGDRYTPLTAAFKEINNTLYSVKDILVLGTGIGSAVQILNKRGYKPNFVLVDSDELVLQWAMELLGAANPKNLTPICANAMEYMDDDTNVYDLVIVDIFQGRIVPAFVTSIDFLEKCKKRIKPGGKLVFNYIISKPEAWDKVMLLISEIFPDNKLIKFGINRVFVATV